MIITDIFSNAVQSVLPYLVTVHISTITLIIKILITLHTASRQTSIIIKTCFDGKCNYSVDKIFITEIYLKSTCAFFMEISLYLLLVIFEALNFLLAILCLHHTVFNMKML